MGNNEIENLKKENEKLKKVLSIKSDMISISAHELRTSLSALKWILKMFIDKDMGEITLEQEAFMNRALVSNNRMIELVNKLLVYNHSEDVDMTFTFKKINILNIIDQTIFEFSGEAKKKNINIILLKPEEKLPEINGDEEMLRVVFQNLVENAIKYGVNEDKVFISLKNNKDKKNIEISIRDTGVGIEKEDQEKIFNKFYRGANSSKNKIPGTGLGLFAAKNIIEHHNGKIWFESTVNNGSTFFITLPVS